MPAVILTLFLASMVAFVVVRADIKINVALLLLFTAGNLLPQQVIITPLYRLYLLIPLPSFISSSGLLYDSIAGLIVINVAFQTGLLRVRAEQLHEHDPGRDVRGRRGRRRVDVVAVTGG